MVIELIIDLPGIGLDGKLWYSLLKIFLTSNPAFRDLKLAGRYPNPTWESSYPSSS